MKNKSPSDKSLIESIQTAINELKVPESCAGKMRGEYVKCGMRLAIEAIDCAIAKYKSRTRPAPGSAYGRNKISGEKYPLPRLMWADCDPYDRKTPVAIYDTKSDQRANRPDLK